MPFKKERYYEGTVDNDSKESEIWLKTLIKAGRPQKNWVHVGDRASDLYDFFKGAIDSGWNFVAVFTLSGRVSVRREVPDAASDSSAMALAIAEESDAADGRLAAHRKLTEKVNTAKNSF